MPGGDGDWLYMGRESKESEDKTRERALIVAARAQEASGRGPRTGPKSLPEFEGYQVLRRLKGGGQGVVYQARQVSSGRIVAIKVLRTGPFASENDRARIEREVRILSRLDHPGIVPVLDCGVSVPDQFYYAMEYIDGTPLDEHVRSGALGARSVLSLMALVCDAVSDAHVRGVIHRDLKPGNILVTGDGVPHVLDFGLAKIQREAEEASEEFSVTRSGQFLGSLPWSSPEQAQGEVDRLDTRTDVYAIGVMMYQALTGTFPYDVQGPAREVVSRIVNDSPLPPSRSSAASNDEIDTIVLKCLSKERERRYQSAGEIARDLRRYLAGEPIEAKRDSTAYVLRKQLQKHWISAAVAAGFALVVLAGTVTSFVLWRQAELARELQAQQTAVAEAVNAFLNDDLLKAADPRYARGREVTVAEILERAQLTVGQKFKGHPIEEAAVRLTIGSTYRRLGRLTPALEQLQMAKELFERSCGADDKRTLSAIRELAVVHDERGQPATAQEMLESILNRYPDRNDEIMWLVMDDLGQVYAKQNRFAEAEQFEERALEGYGNAGLDKTRLGLLCLNNLSYVYRVQGKYGIARERAQEAFKGLSEMYGNDDPVTLSAMNSVAVLFEKQGGYSAAELAMRSCLEGRTRVLGREHHDTLVSMHNLGRVFMEQGKLEEAEALLRDAVEAQRRIFPNDPTDTPGFLRTLGECVMLGGKTEEAEAMLRQAAQEHAERIQGPHREKALSNLALGRLLVKLGRVAEAMPLLQDSASMLEGLLGKNHPETEAAQGEFQRAAGK